MFPIASILLVIIVSCSGEMPEYLKGGVKVQKNTSNALPQVSVAFEPGSLPAATAAVNSVNVYVTSQGKAQSKATKYRYALLSGPTAETGATACAEAYYSEFFPLADPIIVSDLLEGAHLLCARGKNAAGIVQQAATTHAWKVDTSAAEGAVDDDPATEPINDDQPITVVINVSPSTTTVPPPVTVPVIVPTPPPPPPDPAANPAPEPEPAPDPMAKMQVRKNNNSGALSHAFTHGQKDAIPYYVHNTGDADLTWSLKLEAQDAGWLSVEYNGETKIGSAIGFSGVLAANSVSSSIEVSLALDDDDRVGTDYLAVKEVSGKRVETSEYMAKLILKNENMGVSESATVSVYLLIPRLSLKKNSPTRQQTWALPIQLGDYNKKKMYIEKRGKGNLYWKNVKTEYNRFNVTSYNAPNGGHFDIELRRKGRNDNKSPSDGEHTHIGIKSNGGATYKDQPNPSVRWLYVCIVDSNVNTNNEKCPDHSKKPPHH